MAEMIIKAQEKEMGVLRLKLICNFRRLAPNSLLLGTGNRFDRNRELEIDEQAIFSA